MQTLRIYLVLLKRPAGWIAALVFFLINVPIFYFIGRSAAEFGYFEYNAITRVVGTAVFAALIFPLTRILLRGKLEMGPPRWLMWTAIAAILGIVSFGLSYALVVASYIAAPGLLLAFPPEWHQTIIETIIYPAFLGFFVWETGLICGRRSPTLGQAHRFVWGERWAFLLLYLLISAVDLALAMAISEFISAESVLAMEIAFSARYAFFTWFLSLMAIALYVELARSVRPITDVFE